MTRRESLIRVIDLLHAEIAALKSNDVDALSRATAEKLTVIEHLGGLENRMLEPGVRELAEEAQRLNDTARIYVNLMAANVRRRLQMFAGDAGAYRPNGGVPAYA